MARIVSWIGTRRSDTRRSIRRSSGPRSSGRTASAQPQGNGPVLPAGLDFTASATRTRGSASGAGRLMSEVSRFMGHSKPSITESVYAHPLDDDSSDAMNASDAMAASVSEANASNVLQLRA